MASYHSSYVTPAVAKATIETGTKCKLTTHISTLFHMVPGNYLHSLYLRAVSDKPMVVSGSEGKISLDDSLRYPYIDKYHKMDRPCDPCGVYTFALNGIRQISMQRYQLLLLIKCLVLGGHLKGHHTTVMDVQDATGSTTHIKYNKTKFTVVEARAILRAADDHLIDEAVNGPGYAEFEPLVTNTELNSWLTHTI